MIFFFYYKIFFCDKQDCWDSKEHYKVVLKHTGSTFQTETSDYSSDIFQCKYVTGYGEKILQYLPKNGKHI